jgi:hypothetical protein
LSFTDFSGEVYATVVGMLKAASTKGLNSPFEVELRDAQRKVQGRMEMDPNAEGELRETEIARCARGVFPMTVKLVNRDGLGFTEIVERKT